jgi:hypothetical protein
LKKAVLENGLEVMVPLFIREGELIRIEVATGKYLERVKEPGKKCWPGRLHRQRGGRVVLPSLSTRRSYGTNEQE